MDDLQRQEQKEQEQANRFQNFCDGCDKICKLDPNFLHGMDEYDTMFDSESDYSEVGEPGKA